MGVNILFFFVFQLLLEPWKRRRLVGSFEDKVKKALDDHQKEQTLAISEISGNIDSLMDGKLQENPITPIPQQTEDKTAPPELYKILQDLKVWLTIQLTTTYNKLLDLLPNPTFTFTKGYFYSYSTLILTVGMVFGHYI